MPTIHRTLALSLLVLTALAFSLAPPTADAQESWLSDVSVTASLRTRAEAWRWFESAADGDYVYLGSTARVGLVQQRARLGWQIEFAAPILLGLPADAVAPPPQGQAGAGAAYYVSNDSRENVANVFLKQAYLRIGSAPGTNGHGLRIGRFDFVGGAEVLPLSPTLAALKRDRIAHRLVGNFGWSHVGRSFDGLHYAYGDQRYNLTAVAVRPTQGVFNADAWRDLDVGLAYASLTLPQPHANHPGEGRLFGALYVDYREPVSGLVKADNRPLSDRQADETNVTIVTLGGHYLREIVAAGGSIDVLMWGAYQVGDWGVQDHRAWAAAGEVGVQPELLSALRPWLRIGWSRGSGDEDPTDNRHQTFFQLLTTPRIYARLPFYNTMNTQEVFGSLILRPSARVTMRSDLRGLWLSSATDLWYSGGGAYENGSFGYSGRPSGGRSQLGMLADISVDVRLHPRLIATGYLGWVEGADVISAIYPEGPTARLAYIELEFRR